MRIWATFTVSLLASTMIACSPPSADDLVAEIIAVRNNFEVSLSSWIDRDTDTATPYLYLDVDVVKNVEDSLARLTVLVEQLDATSSVLDSQRIPIDVSSMDIRGLSKKYTLEVRPLVAGVEGVRLTIEPSPARETWPEFPELDRVRPRGQ